VTHYPQDVFVDYYRNQAIKLTDAISERYGDVSLVSEQTLARTEFGFLGTCVKLWQ